MNRATKISLTSHIRQIRIMISKAVAGAKLDVKNLIVTGKAFEWSRPSGRLIMPDEYLM